MVINDATSSGFVGPILKDMAKNMGVSYNHPTSADEYGWIPDEELTDYSYESRIVKKLRRLIRQAKQEGKDSLMALLKKALVLQKDREKDARVNKVEPEDSNDFLYGQIVTIGDVVQHDVPVFGMQGNLAFAYFEPLLHIDDPTWEFADDVEFIPVLVTRVGYRTWRLMELE